MTAARAHSLSMPFLCWTSAPVEAKDLARLAPLPPIAVATETYAPNIPVAARCLGPKGITVIRADPNTHRGDGPQPGNRWPERRLPLADNTFDVVLASRSAFSPVEVARVLRPGGRLLTIQNGVEWRGETLADALGGTLPDWTIPGRGWNVGETFRESGLRIVEWREQAISTTYYDIGAVVYMLLHVSWLVVDFEVARFGDKVYALHQRIQRDGAFTTRDLDQLAGSVQLDQRAIATCLQLGARRARRRRR